MNLFPNNENRLQISVRKNPAIVVSNAKHNIQNKSTSPELRPVKHSNDYYFDLRKHSSNPSNHRSFMSRNSNNQSGLQGPNTYQEIIELSYQEKKDQLKKLFTSGMISNVDKNAINDLYDLFFIKPPKLLDDRSRDKDKQKQNKFDDQTEFKMDPRSQDVQKTDSAYTLKNRLMKYYRLKCDKGDELIKLLDQQRVEGGENLLMIQQKVRHSMTPEALTRKSKKNK